MDVAPARLAFLPDDPRLHRVDPAIGDVGELVCEVTRCRMADPWVPARHAEMFFDLVRQGLLDVDRLISDRLACRDAPALYERLQRDRSGVMGAVLSW